MQYKLIGDNNIKKPLETVLSNRGVKNLEGLIDANENNEHHYSKLKNMSRAVALLLKHAKEKNKIFIQADSDADGLTSTAILLNYLKRAFPKLEIQYRLQDGKEHGVLVETIPEDVKLVIIPDAGSSQYEEHKQLYDKGIDVLVLDHHETEKESQHAVVVNNQLSPNYPNKALTGAGIVYKFTQALDAELGKNHAERYLDLVAIGNIADMADSRDLETRFYMKKGLSKIRNPLVKVLFKKVEFSTGGEKTITNVQFYVNPLINGAIRIGTMEEKDQLMRALLESKETVPYKKRGSNVEEMVPITQNTARLLTNLKAKQKRIVDKATNEIQERIIEKGLLNNKILIIYINDILDKKLTGLVANRLVKLHKRPVLLARLMDNDTLGGSVRGYEKGYIKDIKKFLTDTGLFNYCEGHANAHGFSIEIDNLVKVNEIANELLKDVEIDSGEIEVDFEIPADKIKPLFIKDLHSYREHWGQNVEAPLLAVTDLEVNKDEIYLNGKQKNVIKFTVNDVSYVKFFSNEEEYEELVSHGDHLILTIIGKPDVNEYNGVKTAQVLIEDFEVKAAKKKRYIF
ncbi:single-stranded-DNA-specific exonuclease [Terribacillus aidingensis]|uniref:Single-stranded-DNA-specific exonuclease n=1 Tax=Terribacillus aidingensis TaxID=586416 RepID=A0A285NKJ7_9BACI|nr:DHH family phosphoesterase [Terribacillus aidingensis]SNZ10022.1 single-stranded-DNA-specific exonuclease [Terribacillus aidingensis]